MFSNYNTFLQNKFAYLLLFIYIKLVKILRIVTQKKKLHCYQFIILIYSRQVTVLHDYYYIFVFIHYSYIFIMKLLRTFGMNSFYKYDTGGL